MATVIIMLVLFAISALLDAAMEYEEEDGGSKTRPWNKALDKLLEKLSNRIGGEDGMPEH